MGPKIPGGYILLSKRIIESEIWKKPPLYTKVWIYLLCKAQYQNYKKLKKGQLRTSIPEIQENCSWYVGYRKMVPSKHQIYQIIDWLRKVHESNYESDTSETMITTTKATHGMLINIDNYCFYQNPKNYEGNNGGNDENGTKATRKQRQPDNINKEYKEVKKKSTGAEIVWDYYLSKIQELGKERKKTAKKLSHINARIEEGFTTEQLCRAIDNVFADDFMRGNNDRGNEYLEIHNFMSNTEKVEKWLEKRPILRSVQRLGELD